MQRSRWILRQSIGFAIIRILQINMSPIEKFQLSMLSRLLCLLSSFPNKKYNWISQIPFCLCIYGLHTTQEILADYTVNLELTTTIIIAIIFICSKHHSSRKHLQLGYMHYNASYDKQSQSADANPSSIISVQLVMAQSSPYNHFTSDSMTGYWTFLSWAVALAGQWNWRPSHLVCHSISSVYMIVKECVTILTVLYKNNDALMC